MSSREPRPNFVAECFLVRNLSGKKTAFVMVEGETDRAALGQFAAKQCALFPSRGKDNVLYALKSDGFIGVPGIAGIIDLDYALISQSYERELPNLLYDDCCPDMEVILLQSPTLKKILRHELPEEDIAAAHDFADALYRESQRLAAEIGYFRWLNEVEGYRLNFKSLRIADFVDAEPLALDRDWLARRLAESRDGISSEQLLRETAELRENNPAENPQLCRGKDIIAIMAHIMPMLYESHFGKTLPESAGEIFQEERLAKELRKAYEFIYFKQTSLFLCIQEWESANCPYKILKPEIEA